MKGPATGANSSSSRESILNSRGRGLFHWKDPGPGIFFGNESMKIVTLVFLWAACFVTRADPLFVTSDPNGGWSEGGYYVHNNLWNSRKYEPCTSTLHASS